MLRKVLPLLFSIPDNRDTTKCTRVKREVGKWFYTPASMAKFTRWCLDKNVRGHGAVKVASTHQFARLLRTQKKIFPGEALVTVPLAACYNLLSVVKEMYGTQHTFPIEANWMNWDERLPYLETVSRAELVTAGWLARINSLEDSEWAPFVTWVLQDSRGREGIAFGLSRHREKENPELDYVLSEMSNDACEDPDLFVEYLMRAFAAMLQRSVLLPSEAIELMLPGTSFFPSQKTSLHIPTLIPLIDCVPQVAFVDPNCLVEYISYDLLTTRGAALATELGLAETEMAPSMYPKGLFVLRAITALDQGEYLYLREWPKGVQKESELAQKVLEAQRLTASSD